LEHHAPELFSTRTVASLLWQLRRVAGKGIFKHLNMGALLFLDKNNSECDVYLF